MKYRMIGIDLDGTLFNREHEVSEANLRAIQRAHDAGVLIVPCTGRAWNEARRSLQQVPGLREGVFVTGAAVNDVQTGELLDEAPLPAELALDLVNLLADAPDAVLVFREFTKAGHNYLVTGRGQLGDNTKWWFELTESVVHHAPDYSIEHMDHALRVGIAGGHVTLRESYQKVVDHFGDSVIAHAFAAVQKPDPDENIHILEVFAPGVDKWRGMVAVGQRHGIAPEEIAVIGDEINDVAMIRASGCGIAMDNAIDAVKAEARYVTRSNAESGVAHAIDQLMSGAWT